MLYCTELHLILYNSTQFNNSNSKNCSSPHRWSADTEQDGHVPMLQRAIISSQSSLSPLRHVLLLFETSWNLLDAVTFSHMSASMSTYVHTKAWFFCPYCGIHWHCSIFKVRTKPCHCKHKNQLQKELHISPCLKPRASVFTVNQLQIGGAFMK